MAEAEALMINLAPTHRTYLKKNENKGCIQAYCWWISLNILWQTIWYLRDIWILDDFGSFVADNSVVTGQNTSIEHVALLWLVSNRTPIKCTGLSFIICPIKLPWGIPQFQTHPTYPKIALLVWIPIVSLIDLNSHQYSKMWFYMSPIYMFYFVLRLSYLLP